MTPKHVLSSRLEESANFMTDPVFALEKLKCILLWLGFMNIDENTSIHKDRCKRKLHISI